MKIIAFTGMPHSGKSEAVRIAKGKGIPVIRMGDMIWDETKNRGLELTDKNVGKIANDMREKHGKNIWARRTVDVIKKLNERKYIVIDGIRNIEEIQYFKKELCNDMVIITIDASKELRKKRALSRGRTDDSTSIKKIEERDKRELGWGLGDVIASADIIISNEGTLEELRKQITDVFNRL
jgi:dephospho-CoA kinase